MNKRKLIINNSITTVDDESAKKMLISEEGIVGEPLFSFAEENEALYGYKGNGEVIKFITNKEIDSKYMKKTEVAQSDWNETDTTDPAYIKNKPELGTASLKDAPVSGNASDDQVVLGNDTRLLPQDASDVIYDGEHISDFKGANVKESISELEAAIIDDEQATAAAFNDLNDRINEVSSTTIEAINEAKTNLEQTIIENEEVTSASLNDLNDRVNDLYDAKYTGEVKVSNTTGTPSGTVTIDNNNASKKFTFSFSGIKGEKGTDGVIGKDGLSAYEIAKKNGYTGTEEAWLASLKGTDGKIGEDGKSAYEIAQEEGFTGTTDEWLASLKGATGEKGADGKAVTIRSSKSDCKIVDTDAYLEVDSKGTYNVWILRSGSGESGTYENVGPFAIKGDKGDTGAKGDKGDDGASAGIANMHNASVDNNIGTPSVKVTASGPDTAKVFTFDFKNIKGEKGETGAKGEQGPKGDDGKAVTIRSSKAECTVVNSDAYIELDPDSGNYYVYILRSGSGETGEYDNVGPFAIKGDKGDQGTAGASVDRLTTSGITNSSSSQTGNKLTFFAGTTELGSVEVWNGVNGSNGQNGQSATITVNELNTNTGESGSTANVKITESTESTSLNKILNFEFTIPRGDKGEKGETGPQGPKGNDGTGIAVKSSREQCTKDGDAYIEQNELSSNYGHIMIFNTTTNDFVDGGLVKGPKGKSINNVTYSGTTASGGQNKMVVHYLDGDTESQSEEFIIYNGKDGDTGSKGEKGDAGTAAGIASTHNASVDNNIGTPSVKVTASGPDTAKVFTFDFKNIKGEKGETGAKGEQGETGPKGEPGDAGTGISSIDTSRNIYKTTVEINLTDGTQETFDVFNGTDGTNGTDGVGVTKMETVLKTNSSTLQTGNVLTFYAGDTNVGSVTVWNGTSGSNGQDATVTIGEVSTTTGNAGTNAAVTVTKRDDTTLTNPTWDFGFTIPKGQDGKDGTDGVGVTEMKTTEVTETSTDKTGSELEFFAGDKRVGSVTVWNGVNGTTLSEDTVNTINTLANYSIGSGNGNILCGGDSLSAITKSTATIDENGNITGAGTINATGFYETSDENLKWFTGEIPVDFEQLKSIPKEYFIWRNRETPTNIGTSAQKVQKIYPELVMESEGHLTVDYSKLSIVALKAIDLLNEKIERLEAEIRELKSNS